MKLTGELKTKVEQAETREEAKDILEKAGVVLDDRELDQVAGGGDDQKCRFRQHMGL